MYKATIGLEVHVELKTKSKMFCSCLNDALEVRPNINICPVCMGHPGTLPVINQEAVRKVIKTGLALNSDIPGYSKFDRKNYFYPDLPKGYQISQYDKPLCLGGELIVNGKKVRITRVHLEEDTGRLLHPKGTDYSLVDFNRAGVPLMELVTEPDLKTAKEARAFAENLQLILRYLDVSAADMEKGQMRVEANISVNKKSEKKLGTKVEIKNLNSFRAVEKGIDYEIDRQIDVLKSGKKIVQETMGWDETKNKTVIQREKEEAHDYRYFPEPDLPPLTHSKKLLDEIRAEIPELPQGRRERFKKEYGLPVESTEIFVFYKDLGEYFEKVVSELNNWVEDIEMKQSLSKVETNKLVKLASNYILSDLQSLLKGKTGEIPITPENFAEFISFLYEGKISSRIGKDLLGEMFKTGGDPSQIIQKKGLIQITDEKEIEKVIKEVILQNKNTVEDFKKGKESALQYLVGQVMMKTKGKANPQSVQAILKKNLK